MISPSSELAPEQWPSPPPMPKNPAKYRDVMLTERERLNRYQVDQTSKQIEHYPELQAATLKLLHENPSVHFVQHVAEELLKALHPGERPSDDDRLRAIALARTALRAAAEFVDPPEEEEEVPF